MIELNHDKACIFKEEKIARFCLFFFLARLVCKEVNDLACCACCCFGHRLIPCILLGKGFALLSFDDAYVQPRYSSYRLISEVCGSGYTEC